MTTWKPYIFEGRDYLDARKINSWEDLVAQYPGVDIPRSELNKPYARENYQADEWSWPGWEPPPIYWPEWPPQYPNPPGGGNPCEADDECKYLGIIGPALVECEEEVWFKNVLVWEGCTLPPGALMVGWSASCGKIRAVGVGARWTAPDTGAVCQICASGPGCQACIDVTVECGVCCEEIALTGADTVNAGNPWTGIINPACPGLKCPDNITVISNSGCTLGCSVNEAGSLVTVTPGGGDCGAFTVTIDASFGGDCDANTASKTVRINGGGATWAFVSAVVNNCNDSGNCGCGYGSATPYPACMQGEFKYGTNNGATFDCSQNFGYACVAGNDCGTGAPYPPCGGGATCGDPGGACGGGPEWCTNKIWHKCEWKCGC